MAQYRIGQRVRGSGVIMPGIAGETITRAAAIYMSAVDGLWYLADSDALATLPTVGLANDGGITGNKIQILLVGIIGRSDWAWTRGDTLYASGTPGVLTQVAPANAQPVAVALTATLAYVNPVLSVLGGGGVTHDTRYVYPIDDNSARGNNNPVVGRVYIRPIQFTVPMTIDRLGTVITTANGSGRMAIYADNGDTPTGGAVVVETASNALVVNVNEWVIGATTIATPGLYWIALQLNDVTALLPRADQGTPTSLPGGTVRNRRYDRGGGYGAFTDPCPAVIGTTDFPFMMYTRVASVP